MGYKGNSGTRTLSRKWGDNSEKGPCYSFHFNATYSSQQTARMTRAFCRPKCMHSLTKMSPIALRIRTLLPSSHLRPYSALSQRRRFPDKLVPFRIIFFFRYGTIQSDCLQNPNFFFNLFFCKLNRHLLGRFTRPS